MREHGIIQGVQIALGTGMIRPDDGGDDLTFVRGGLVAGAFEELREGQPVAFTSDGEGIARGRHAAREVRVLDE